MIAVMCDDNPQIEKSIASRAMVATKASHCANENALPGSDARKKAQQHTTMAQRRVPPFKINDRRVCHQYRLHRAPNG